MKLSIGTAFTGTLLSCLLSISASHAQDTPATDTRTQATATAMLQRMIDETKGLVEIPAGSFIIDKPLRVDLTTTGYRGIRGANGATRIIMRGPGPALHILGDHQGTADPASLQAHTWEKERLPIISDLEILGEHPEADGITLYRTMQCTIQNVLIRRCRYGIHLVERNRNFLLANSHIYDGSDTGVFLDNCNLHQINIIGNHISYNKRAGIRQFNGDVHNVQITGNDIEYNSGSEESSGEIVLEAEEGLISEYTIVSNTIQARPENPGANILIAGAEKDTPHAARTIAISGNIIGSRDKSIILRHACRTTISGNTIYGGKTLSLHVQQSKNIVVNGNNIGSRPSMHSSSNVYDDGLLFEDCGNCLITGNILSEHRCGTEERGGAITLVNAEHCRVSTCQILQPRLRGVHIIGGTGCVISDNTITAAPNEDFRAAIEVAGGQAHLLQNNWVQSALPQPLVMGDAFGESRNNTLVSNQE